MAERKSYDYVIVGAGSAGCVLAYRLTANPSIRVLLLEAGGRDTNPLIHVPIGLGKIWEHRMFDWGYNTEPEPRMDNRLIEELRGKGLGGSSSINVMAYVRGHRGDYDRWAQNGCRGWSYADVLPYFRKAEHQVRGADEFHGSGGPLGVGEIGWRGELSEAFVRAAIEAGRRTRRAMAGRSCGSRKMEGRRRAIRFSARKVTSRKSSRTATGTRRGSPSIPTPAPCGPTNMGRRVATS